jgi:hypothetical protein
MAEQRRHGWLRAGQVVAAAGLLMLLLLDLVAGLMGLGERVGSLGGQVQAGPGIEGRWVVDAAIPLAPAGRTVVSR